MQKRENKNSVFFSFVNFELGHDMVQIALMKLYGHKQLIQAPTAFGVLKLRVESLLNYVSQTTPEPYEYIHSL